ncbi:ABC transporter substrate-binding protein [Cohnella cellulosilytica]|uniref:ABC transporter substrate-binding protein n=1 Tax=Cohnella cellulosilytica TaxID=986710 RepID=A0ABW2FPT1_9BACL
MMKKWFTVPLIGIMAVVLVLSGCSGNSGGNESSPSPSASPTSSPSAAPSESAPPEESAAPSEEASEFPPLPEEELKDISGEVVIWSFWELASLTTFFNTSYPNVKVNNVVMSTDEMHNKLKTVLASGKGVPDVVMIDGSRMGEFNTIEGLDDLLQQPYDFGKYQPFFADSHWQRFQSLDGTKQLSVPWTTPPGLAFYRADIMDAAGFPSDPAEFGEYIQDKDNFIYLAKTLAADKKYTYDWDTTIVNLMTSGIGYFDRDLNWLRNDDKFVAALDLAKDMKKEKLASYINFYDDQGAQALASGTTTMFYSGDFGVWDIDGKAPDTKGKWRVTNLPFGAYGGMGGASLAIPSQAKNKLAGWEYIRLNILGMDYSNKEAIQWSNPTGFLPAFDLAATEEKPLEILGGQKPLMLYKELVKNIPLNIPTPLDAKAEEIWNKMLQESIDKNVDSRTALQQIQEAVERAVSKDKEALLKKLGKS